MFHFIVDGVDRMAIASSIFFFVTAGITLYECLHFFEIEMAQHEYVAAFEKIVALDIKESL